MAKRFLVLIALLMLGFYVAGCAEGDESASVVNPNPSALTNQKGSISGVVMDSCTNAPIQGAIVSVAYSGGVHSVTTGTTGTFSFNNVPINYEYYTGVSGFGGATDTGNYGYQVVCDLRSNTTYGYAWVSEVWVVAGDLADGSNWGIQEAGITEGGSGADTPVSGIDAAVRFSLAPLNASISGTIYDVSSGRSTAVGTGVTVDLFYGSKYVNTVQVDDTTGAYSFDKVIPNLSYTLMVNKPGYTYAQFQSTKVGSPNYSCGTIPVSCSVGCRQDIAGVDINMMVSPTGDRTIPYIVAINANGASDSAANLIDDDEVDFQVTSFTAQFNEAMKRVSSLSMKNDGAVTLSSSFNYTIEATTLGTLSGSMDIINDYTLAWSTDGLTLTVTADYVSVADIVDDYNAKNGTSQDLDTDNDPIESISVQGKYHLNFDSENTHLMDANGVMWSTYAYSIDTVAFYLNWAGAYYQNAFIFWNGNGELNLATSFDWDI